MVSRWDLEQRACVVVSGLVEAVAVVVAATGLRVANGGGGGDFAMLEV
jgi:hypothetical protein